MFKPSSTQLADLRLHAAEEQELLSLSEAEFPRLQSLKPAKSGATEAAVLGKAAMPRGADTPNDVSEASSSIPSGAFHGVHQLMQASSSETAS